MKLTLYYYEQCPFCQLVLQKIQELGLDIPLANVLENQDHLKTLVETTGRRTVPCLFIDGTPMFESRDICQWLSDNKDTIGEQNGS